MTATTPTHMDMKDHQEIMNVKGSKGTPEIAALIGMKGTQEIAALEDARGTPEIAALTGTKVTREIVGMADVRGTPETVENSMKDTPTITTTTVEALIDIRNFILHKLLTKH